MGYFGKFTSDKKVEMMSNDGVDGTGGSEKTRLSTPFLEIGKGNLSLPLIDTRVSTGGMVYFGAENLFPQILDQIYYVSPLHGSIVDFMTRATVGGGFEIDHDLTARELVDFKMFEQRFSLKRLLMPMTRELIIHARVYFELTLKGGKLVKIKRVPPAYVRTNEEKTKYYISKNWLQRVKEDILFPYTPDRKDGRFLYVYERETPGDYPYPLPQYVSALNWCFLDGEMSLLHKSNIQNSIFASFMLSFPKKPSSPEERETIKDTIENAKGAKEAGRIFAFFANGKDYLPELTPVPTNNNDQLFIQTDGRIDEKICQAHTIDPLLMGIRVSGKLGSGTDIKQAYTIWEKNTILPLREEIELIVREIMDIASLPKVNFSVKNFQIIGDQISDKTDTTE